MGFESDFKQECHNISEDSNYSIMGPCDLLGIFIMAVGVCIGILYHNLINKKRD